MKGTAAFGGGLTFIETSLFTMRLPAEAL